MTMSMLTVWFYDPASEAVTGANFVNKVVAGFYPPFCHTELQFPSGEACSIVMNGTVRLRTRTYDPPLLPSRTNPAIPVSQPNPKAYAGNQPPLFPDTRSSSNATSCCFSPFYFILAHGCCSTAFIV